VPESKTANAAVNSVENFIMWSGHSNEFGSDDTGIGRCLYRPRRAETVARRQGAIKCLGSGF
jgi:hypothetical protein